MSEVITTHYCIAETQVEGRPVTGILKDAEGTWIGRWEPSAYEVAPYRDATGARIRASAELTKHPWIVARQRVQVTP